MKKVQLFAVIFFLILFMPFAVGVLEMDWGKYTRVDESKRDGTGEDITLNWLVKSYRNPNEDYSVKVRDFDAQGTVVLVVTYKGRDETILLSGIWNDNRTKIILPEPIKAFDKNMIITALKIVAPAGVFTCCPEAEININLIRPELFLEYDADKETTTEYRLVNPYANWNIYVDRDNPYISPFDGSIETEKNTTTEKHNAYRINDKIPMKITVTNYGENESYNTLLYIYTDGLLFEDGKPNTDLPNLGGKHQVGFNGRTTYATNLTLKFPIHPGKLNYTVHAYVKGENNNNIYYYDDIKVITLLPSIGLQKSVTKESVLMNRSDVESIYPSIDPDEISRWLQSRDIFVTLGVTNYQNNELKNVNLYDTLHKQSFIENKSLNWTFNIKPGETKEFTYKIRINRPGTFKLPSALLTYSELNMTWNLVSNNPTTEVHGPCIQILKEPDKPVIIEGNYTNITITLRNSGDMPSKVEINDSLPENSTLIEGQTHYERRILPRESVVFSYMISMDNEGQVELPDPILYVNGKESPVCGELLKSRILVQRYVAPGPVKTILIPKETPVEIQNPADARNDLFVKYSWLEGVIPAFMLFLAIIVLYMLYRKNI
jgi:hypothetical protein